MKQLLLVASLALVACASRGAAPADGSGGDAPDQCSASQYQQLVGKKLIDLPAKPDGAIWRTACTECAMTMDFNPRRMNIVFDRESEVIKEIRCG
jgi:hypothetical protein